MRGEVLDERSSVLFKRIEIGFVERERERETITIFSQDNGSRDRDSNPGSPEYDAGMLTST
jgi:hypothetical protein